MAVAARSPSPSDARVPCPLCGGLIHPIAGRCKHCKADLASYRSSRPAAAAALPALAAPVAVPVVAGPTDQTFAPNGFAAPQPVISPVAVVALANPQDESRPVLPPRPTGRMQTAPQRSVWRNWPLIVIVLAVIAIAAAVVLMLWPPPKSANASSRGLAPPPAPERMDTNPMPTNPRMQPAPSPGDPWSPPHGSITPRSPSPSPSAPPIDDPDTIDPDDLAMDPFSSPRPGRGGGLTNPFNPTVANDLMVTVMKHACNRMKNCGNSSVASVCTMVDQLPSTAPPPSCAAAQRCIDKVDQLDCNGGQLDDLSALTSLFSTLEDCTDALRC